MFTLNGCANRAHLSKYEFKPFGAVILMYPFEQKILSSAHQGVSANVAQEFSAFPLGQCSQEFLKHANNLRKPYV